MEQTEDIDPLTGRSRKSFRLRGEETAEAMKRRVDAVEDALSPAYSSQITLRSTLGAEARAPHPALYFLISSHQYAPETVKCAFSGYLPSCTTTWLIEALDVFSNPRWDHDADMFAMVAAIMNMRATFARNDDTSAALKDLSPEQLAVATCDAADKHRAVLAVGPLFAEILVRLGRAKRVPDQLGWCGYARPDGSELDPDEADIQAVGELQRQLNEARPANAQPAVPTTEAPTETKDP